MESTKLFNQLSLDLKNKIYEKYNMNLKEVINTIKPIILEIYGKQYSDIIDKKLSQIHLISFFEKSDLNLYFYNSSDSFRPLVLNSNNTKLEIENNTNDLEEKFKELFVNEDNSFKIEKIYDEDVIEYNNLAYEYDSNLYDEYSLPYRHRSLPEEIHNKRRLEYDINSSMYSCFRDEISKLNLILDSDLLYKNLKNILFLSNSSLICNVNNNFEKTDIIVINPIKFNEKDIFYLIRDIISSINTNLLVSDEKIFTFDRGLNDCFIKHNFNHGIEYDNRGRRNLIDFVNNSLTLEVIDYLSKNNLSIWNYSTFPTSVSSLNNTSVFARFYNSYKALILDSIITKNTSKLFDRIGEKNFIDFLDTSFQFVEESKKAYLSNSNCTPETNSFLNSLYQKRENLLEIMKNFNTNN